MFKFIELPRSSFTVVIHVGTFVLGIEVTQPEQLQLCTLGNVDGQHSTGRAVAFPGKVYDVRAIDWSGRAACDIAAEIPLPPDGAVLATTRADLDSIGAMAVLMLRKLDLWPETPETLQAAHDRATYTLGAPTADEIAHAVSVWGRLRRVAERDCFRPAADWRARPLPTIERPWGEATTVDSDQHLSHVASICSPRPGDPVLGVPERVGIIALWLLYGDSTSDPAVADRIWKAIGGALTDEISTADFVRLTLSCARDHVDASRRALAEEVAGGAVTALCGCGSADSTHLPGAGVGGPCQDCGDCRRPVAIVRARHAGALGVGYCVAPIVVAFDQGVAGKVTICGWTGPDGETRYLDVPRLRARLTTLDRCEIVQREIRSHDGRVAAYWSADPGARHDIYLDMDPDEQYEIETAMREIDGTTWGGPPALIGSPQVDGGTRLSEATILREVLACVTR